MTTNYPRFVGSRTSGVDGSSEGGRLSTVRLPQVLVLYSVPLLQTLKNGGYKEKLAAEPALVGGVWALKVIYEGDDPPPVPERWHGHRVVVEKAAPPDA